MLSNEQISSLGIKRIYRYRGAIDYNFDSLLKNQIFAATPNILNDPLDCGITYKPEALLKRLIKTKHFQNHISFLIRNVLSSKESLSFKKLTASDKNFILQEINDLAKKIIYEIRECFGIVSFSINEGNKIMWSHYASEYRGFVLGYDFESMNASVNKYIESHYEANKMKELYGFHVVDYVASEEMIDGTNLMYELISQRLLDKNENKCINRILIESKYISELVSLLATKDESWKYEQEIRLILPRTELFEYEVFHIMDTPIPQCFMIADNYAPSEIIIGSRMSTINKAIIGFYCFRNERVNLFAIDTSKLMSEKTLYKSLIKPSNL